MEAIKLLGEYKKRVDAALVKYFERKQIQAAKNDPLAREAIKLIADFTMAAGKRIRPAMVYYAYLAAEKNDSQKIVDISIAIELTHTFLLIHDDIIDKDESRHGVLTLHEQYKKIGKKLAPRKDSHHFGNSMAMLAGDMAAAMSNEIIFNSQFPPEVIIRALDKLQEIVYNIVPGEMLDVVLEARGNAREEEVMRMYEGKTSSYSFEGPLHLGSLLAGMADKNILNSYSSYSMPLGKAFQIRDDILGIFGSQKKIGKPIGSDVIEGKQTLLVIKALEFGSSGQKNAIKNYLGKKDLSREELDEFRKIIEETGSLKYAEDLSVGFVQESLCALKNINIKNGEAKRFLEGIARYMIERHV